MCMININIDFKYFLTCISKSRYEQCITEENYLHFLKLRVLNLNVGTNQNILQNSLKNKSGYNKPSYK